MKAAKENRDPSVLKELMVLETGKTFDMDEMFEQLGKLCEVSQKPEFMILKT